MTEQQDSENTEFRGIIKEVYDDLKYQKKRCESLMRTEAELREQLHEEERLVCRQQATIECNKKSIKELRELLNKAYAERDVARELLEAERQERQ